MAETDWGQQLQVQVTFALLSTLCQRQSRNMAPANHVCSNWPTVPETDYGQKLLVISALISSLCQRRSRETSYMSSLLKSAHFALSLDTRCKSSLLKKAHCAEDWVGTPAVSNLFGYHPTVPVTEWGNHLTVAKKKTRRNLLTVDCVVLKNAGTF